MLKAKAVGVIATQDLLDLDLELVSFLSREERPAGPPIRGLYDFSEVAALAVPQSRAAERGNRPSILRGQRVMVQSQASGCSLVDAFAHSQRQAGIAGLSIVNSLDEAHALLGMDGARYEDI
ncbi:MAG: hypothetical protein JSR24_13110 [Proteobacteria bacterium]|nr:hypothetical protein [Pseudomonadota bacterium]